MEDNQILLWFLQQLHSMISKLCRNELLLIELSLSEQDAPARLAAAAQGVREVLYSLDELGDKMLAVDDEAGLQSWH